ncbi:bifunctional phosphopantothenoylcysteine decarboxylase/phosphopantothenate--cysteine ligase CoaBC [Carnobacterium divergens]|uniref:Coenzyme A biosynthesis bifunctional protein CoaBC n=1 Tax=Carnobacterium divergens TaxID=2748 RepID=A0AAW8RBM8_CARDV|nr:bifunctional phosphopantothenoylcysteine decarboxylase/phosphopantothenate--cysteine ligase CoaBC [Carnobacterium divergens]MDT1957435.1 bifunctional phosphopantothenoylcysteine decarboxylase/phosphopantothenate--cysteine ligase CoaBC [Carnobacterium divergens]MDT1973638.1 bifunctional phosphopantothenoylcysteine decarboxylase/phosphopantothenate--cysteine ligase CoaBC [Carnobacterium divergens]
MLKNKKIAVYVTGGIAVYKVCDLVRKFIKAGADVKVAMTASATEFVTPLTFQVLSKNDVYLDTFDEKVSSEVGHIHLADWCDLAVVAPATANIIAKMANGIADDFVSTALLATTAPIFIAPAMNQHMFENPATVRNLTTLQVDGRMIIEPNTGFLAEGYVGKGRLPEPDEILAFIEAGLLEQQIDLPLSTKKVIITAGGTKERIDPVRFITNDSSGKMGYSLAKSASLLGADVTLISTTSNLPLPVNVTRVIVESSQEMEQAVLERFATSDIVIMAAAVSDYRPIQEAKEKIKKTESLLTLELEKTTDILATLGKMKDHQLLIGFAAETTNLAEYAKGKLAKKKADMIVANDVSKSDTGFNSDTNEVTIFTNDQEPIHVSVRSKDLIADEILQVALSKIKK